MKKVTQDQLSSLDISFKSRNDKRIEAIIKENADNVQLLFDATHEPNSNTVTQQFQEYYDSPIERAPKPPGLLSRVFSMFSREPTAAVKTIPAEKAGRELK